MTKLFLCEDGKYRVFKRTTGNNHQGKTKAVTDHGKKTSERNEMKNWRNWWLVKHADGGRASSVCVNYIMVPKELIGKRLRFVVEVLK